MQHTTETLAPARPSATIRTIILPHPEPSITALLSHQASVRPDETAAVSAEGRLTFRELESAARALAARLRRIGVGPDDCVGLYAEPSLDLLVGAWGILFAGAAYLPLSPEYPEERVRYMVDDSRCAVVVAQRSLEDRLTQLAPRTTRVILPHHLRGEGGEDLAPPAPEALAYVIYTSGSTGRPKGVMIEHRSIAAQLRWLHACGHLGPDVTILQKTPMSFDAAQWEILAPAAGSRVVVGAPGLYRDPEALVTTIIEGGVTALQCVPTLLQALLDTGRFDQCAGLRRVFSGGEGLSRKLARAFADTLPRASLVNLYGPTECTINATAHVVDLDAVGAESGTVPIGVPVDNTTCYILDAQMAPVGIEETGELYIGGVQLARGYLHQPELTGTRFVRSPFVPSQRLYKTGDLARWNEDGTVQFVGRADNQVKLRGYRVELDEVALAIEEHAWVRRAAAVLVDNPRTGQRDLVGCIELNPREAALMDQGSHGGHHQSKESRLQVRAQLSNAGLRDAEDLRGRAVLALPGREESARQRRAAYARKTYRYFDGGCVTGDDLRSLLAEASAPRIRPAQFAVPDEAGAVGIAQIGEILRWFGQFHSAERLLPKYSYASPGALYAVQMYLQSEGAFGIDPGVHYYHPADHALVRITDRERPRAGDGASADRLLVHFAGRRQAIEPVYRTNIGEVLEMEVGHMLGVFEEALAPYGLTLRPAGYDEAARGLLGIADEDHYLGTFELSAGPVERGPADDTELFVQAHPGRIDGLATGLYRFAEGRLAPVSEDVILSRHVIAINQRVYHRAGFGVAVVSRAQEGWLRYISLGAMLHRLQRNRLGLGLMSSGYSSKTGHPLPAARRLDDLIASRGIDTGPSYFALGGALAQSQIESEGMYEDTVHMMGPAELVKEELAQSLPSYMIPNRILVVDRLPLTSNGKVDNARLAAEASRAAATSAAPYTAPSTPTERWLAEQWARTLHYDQVSTQDEFFASGGNSLVAVALVNRINKTFGSRLPMQVLFESPRLADLARRIETGTREPSPRIIALQREGCEPPVFCWPGLGGYPMNLRELGTALGTHRPFHGIQARGLNEGEQPFATIGETAAADIAEIRRIQPEGPYTLYGYSFGARVAFEAAWQLEQAGHEVDALLLLCPGNPKVGQADAARHGREAVFDNPAYLTILFSVFTGRTDGPHLERCLRAVGAEDDFVRFIHELLPALDTDLIRRITRIVEVTYEFDYTFHELAERRLAAPIGIVKAAGDDYSFLEGSSGYSTRPPRTIELGADHYSVLRQGAVADLAAAIRTLHGA